MDTSQKHIVEEKEPGIKEYIIHDSVYAQLKKAKLIQC